MNRNSNTLKENVKFFHHKHKIELLLSEKSLIHMFPFEYLRQYEIKTEIVLNSKPWSQSQVGLQKN
jgi:aspartate carbamoyltransferase catalytic subunit